MTKHLTLQSFDYKKDMIGKNFFPKAVELFLYLYDHNKDFKAIADFLFFPNQRSNNHVYEALPINMYRNSNLGLEEYKGMSNFLLDIVCVTDRQNQKALSEKLKGQPDILRKYNNFKGFIEQISSHKYPYINTNPSRNFDVLFEGLLGKIKPVEQSLVQQEAAAAAVRHQGQLPPIAARQSLSNVVAAVTQLPPAQAGRAATNLPPLPGTGNAQENTGQVQQSWAMRRQLFAAPPATLAATTTLMTLPTEPPPSYLESQQAYLNQRAHDVPSSAPNQARGNSFLSRLFCCFGRGNNR